MDNLILFTQSSCQVDRSFT